jgi:hypothetical protein
MRPGPHPKLPMFLHDPIFLKYFPDGYTPAILPKAFAAKIAGKGLADLKMTKFKPGGFAPTMEIESHHNLLISGCHTNPKSMYAFCVLDGKCFLAYESYLLSNFGYTGTVLNGVPIMCVEHFFKLCCAIWHWQLKHPKALEVMEAVFFAPTPGDAKNATKAFSPTFDCVGWASEGKRAMFLGVAGSLTNEKFFSEVQKCIAFSQFITHSDPYQFPEGKFRVGEAKEDPTWGLNKGCQAAIEILKAKVDLNPDGDLFALVDSSFDGKSQLGDIMLDMMRIIYGKTYQQYLAYLSDFEFFRTEETEVAGA